MRRIERRDDPVDRRAKRVHLAHKAKPMLEKLSKLGQKIRKQAFDGIAPQEEELLRSVLLRMRENLSEPVE